MCKFIHTYKIIQYSISFLIYKIYSIFPQIFPCNIIKNIFLRMAFICILKVKKKKTV